MLKLKSKTSFKGGHYTSGVGKTSKTRDPKCSKAMSDWKSSGKLTHEIALILGKCRSQARQQRTGAKPSLSNEWAFSHKLETRAARPTEIAKRLTSKVEKIKKGTSKKVEVAPKETQKGSHVIHSREGKTYEIDKEKAKYIGKTVGKEERGVADEAEKQAAAHMGAEWLPGSQPGDSRAVTANGVHHYVESKSKIKGEANEIVHRNYALYRKHKTLREHPEGKSEFHTVVSDIRNTHEGGIHSHLYSGHPHYYKRGVGNMSFSQMHPVDDPAELKRLRDMPEKDLPELARPPKSYKEVRESEEKYTELAGKGEHSKALTKAHQDEYAATMKSLGLSRHTVHKKTG